MKAVFQQQIIDFHKEAIPDPTRRKLSLPELPPQVRKGFVYIGMRRSGKTWAMYQQMLYNDN